MLSSMTPMMLVWNGATLLVIASMFVIAALRHRSLPQKVPCHFGLDGRPDGWSGPGFIWFYPVIALALTAVMNFDEAEGAEADDMLIAAVFLYLQVRTLAIADHRATGLGRWFVVVLVGVIVLGVYINW